MDTNVHFEGNHRSEEVENGFEIYPSALNIIWGKDARYWKLPQGERDPATLVQVSWLEVTGWCDKVEKDTRYDVKFELKLTPDAFGFELPIYFMLKSGKKSIWKKLYLTKDANVEPNNGSYIVPKNLTITTDKSIFEDNKLCFGLYEVWSGKWKGGLIIQKVLIQKINMGD